LALSKNIWVTASPLIKPILEILKVWWWLPLPFLLGKPFFFLLRWWRVDVWLATVYKPILLEIKIPKDSLKPIRAMEEVMTSIHAVITQPPDFWEKWIEGQFQTSICFEIISVGGEIHFYIRFHADYRQAIESSIYAQFPEAEITQVQDYTKNVPQNIPNKDWDKMAAQVNLGMTDLNALIIDVRGNPGGYLQSAVHIAGEFFRNDVVLYEETYS